MEHFFSLNDVDDPEKLVREALEYKFNPLSSAELGKGRSICLIFFNASLRTRFSTVRAAENLGLKVSILNITEDSWQLEFEEGVIMDQGKAEHIKDAAAVLGSYYDLIGVRSFPKFESRADDYSEKVLRAFMNYSGIPVVNLESCTLHPLQSLADLITIRENAHSPRPKVVLSWAPHTRALPQAVANSFSQWMSSSSIDFVITHPEGLELETEFTQNARLIHNQKEALIDADFVYVKNWSPLDPYGSVHKAPDWIMTKEKMKLTNRAFFMHCLPVRRNVVVEDAVIDSPRSLVIEQATNRIWAAQSVLKNLLQS